MSRVVSTLLGLCLLRGGPQDLPYSPALLILCLLAYGALGVQMARLGLPAVEPLTFSVIDIALLLGFVWFILSFKGLYSRFNQAATALAGTGALMGLIAWVLLSWQTQLLNQHASISLVSLLLLAHLVWHLAIIAGIVRHTLSITLTWAWGVTLVYFFIYMVIIRLVMVAISSGTS